MVISIYSAKFVEFVNETVVTSFLFYFNKLRGKAKIVKNYRLIFHSIIIILTDTAVGSVGPQQTTRK